MSDMRVLDLLSPEELVALRNIGEMRIDSFFGDRPVIRVLIQHRLVDAENGFLRLTLLGEETVKAMPVSSEKRP